MIAVHLFNLIFLRWKATRTGFIATLFAGWTFVILVVVIGPAALQKAAKGPYFGISGDW